MAKAQNIAWRSFPLSFCGPFFWPTYSARAPFQSNPRPFPHTIPSVGKVLHLAFRTGAIFNPQEWTFSHSWAFNRPHHFWRDLVLCPSSSRVAIFCGNPFILQSSYSNFGFQAPQFRHSYPFLIPQISTRRFQFPTQKTTFPFPILGLLFNNFSPTPMFPQKRYRLPFPYSST